MDGVPHIYASTSHDLFFAHGLCTLDGNQLPLRWTREQIDEAAEGVLVLQPSG